MIQSLKHTLRSPAHQMVMLLAITCIALQYAGLSDQLRFDRSRIDSGQWWLLLSGNFVHLGLGHLWMNLAGLALVVALVWNHFSASQWLLAILLSSASVGVGLWIFNPYISFYVGFSGVLHGLILAGTLAGPSRISQIRHSSACTGRRQTGVGADAGALPGSESMAGAA